MSENIILKPSLGKEDKYIDQSTGMTYVRSDSGELKRVTIYLFNPTP